MQAQHYYKNKNTSLIFKKYIYYEEQQRTPNKTNLIF